MGLEQAFGRYEHFLDSECRDLGNSGMNVDINLNVNEVLGYKTPIDFVLRPGEIDEFLQRAGDFNFGQCLYSEKTAAYLTKLIQNSFRAGNNHFHLHIPDKSGSLGYKQKALDFIGFRLRGTPSQNIIVDVYGSLGSHCFTGSVNCSAFLEGSVQDNFARWARDGVFSVKGDTGDTAGHSSGCRYYFYGKVKSGFEYAKNNEFTAYSEQALETLKKCVPAGNSIWHVPGIGHDIANRTRITRLRDRWPFLEQFMRQH